MPIVSIKTVISTVNATLNILEMVVNVITNVLTVATTVMPMLPVPIPSVLELAHVIPDMMVTVLIVLVFMNVLLTHITLMTLALTMMTHTSAPVMTVSTMMIKHFTDTPMLPVQTTTVPIAAHVKVFTPMTVLPALIMINVHSEQTIAVSTCDPHAACTNIDASFECACDAGYAGDGFT